MANAALTVQGRKLKAADRDRLTGGRERRMHMQKKKKKKEREKGRDLLKSRLRLESAQTVAAAVKHAFFSSPL